MEPNNTIPNQNIEPAHENSVGPVIAIVIVLAMIVLGGLYFWNERSKTNTPVDGTQNNLEEMAASIENQSSSDEPSSIEKDLENTNVDNLDKDLQSL